ncbi:hypothetical protein HK405_014627 [Cladochytrium tenue]|nr:hypothetical protein HK405_014627 [Cladochytrium tenue]
MLPGSTAPHGSAPAAHEPQTRSNCGLDSSLPFGPRELPAGRHVGPRSGSPAIGTNAVAAVISDGDDDDAADAPFTGMPSLLKARRSVRDALRGCPLLDRFHIARVLGYGSNGVVLAATVLPPPLSPSQTMLQCAAGAHSAAAFCGYSGGGENSSSSVEDELARLPVGFAVAIKIVYRGTAAAAAAATRELAVLRAAAGLRRDGDTSRGSRLLLQLHASWQDAERLFLVTELFGNDWLAAVRGSVGAGARLPAPPPPVLAFFNPRTGVRHAVPMSSGAADAWALAAALTLHASADRKDATAGDVAGMGASVVRAIFRQVARAVLVLHTGIPPVVHGDIKSENVLVQARSYQQQQHQHQQQPQDDPRFQYATPPHSPIPPVEADSGCYDVGEDGEGVESVATATATATLACRLEVRLCDFGHAALGPANDRDAPRLRRYGTPLATAPELLRLRLRAREPDDGVDGRPADAFALGVLLYALCSGPGSAPAAQRVAAASSSVGRGAAATAGMAVAAQQQLLPESGPLPLKADEERALAAIHPACVELFRGLTMCDPIERWDVRRAVEHPWLR